MRGSDKDRQEGQVLLEAVVTIFLLSLMLAAFLVLFGTIERTDVTSRLKEEANAIAESEVFCAEAAALAHGLPSNRGRDNQGGAATLTSDLETCTDPANLGLASSDLASDPLFAGATFSSTYTLLPASGGCQLDVAVAFAPAGVAPGTATLITFLPVDPGVCGGGGDAPRAAGRPRHPRALPRRLPLPRP